MNFLVKNGIKIGHSVVTATIGGIAGYRFCVYDKFGSHRNMKQYEELKEKLGRYEINDLAGSVSFVKHSLDNRYKIESVEKVFQNYELRKFVNDLCDEQFDNRDLKVLKFMNDAKRFLVDGGNFDIKEHNEGTDSYTDYTFCNKGMSSGYTIRVCDDHYTVYNGDRQIMEIRNNKTGLETMIGSKTSFIPKTPSQTQNGNHIFPIDNTCKPDGSIKTDKTGVNFISKFGSHMGLNIKPDPVVEHETKKSKKSVSNNDIGGLAFFVGVVATGWFVMCNVGRNSRSRY